MYGGERPRARFIKPESQKYYKIGDLRCHGDKNETSGTTRRPSSSQSVSSITDLLMVDISLPTTEEERDPLETLREVILSIVKIMLPWQDGAEMAEDE